jgi:RimJ/RimL family protein N-acetyltransferase
MLKGKLVGLVPFSKEYIPAFLKWLNDPEITQYLMIYLPLTLEQEMDYYEKAVRDTNSVRFSIVINNPDQHPEKLIGNIGADINWKDRVATLGILIGEKDYWGKGYGADALNVMIGYCFSTLNMARVELSTYEYNIRAQKCYHKVGFIDEGIKRKAKYHDGNYYDILMMGFLRDDWDSKNKK